MRVMAAMVQKLLNDGCCSIGVPGVSVFPGKSSLLLPNHINKPTTQPMQKTGEMNRVKGRSVSIQSQIPGIVVIGEECDWEKLPMKSNV